MKLIDKNKIDLIITDPPFAINFKAKKANYNRKGSLMLLKVIMKSYLKTTINLVMIGFRRLIVY